MEIAISAGGAVAEKVVEKVFAPVGDQLCYLFYYNDNIENLKYQVRKLKESTDKVQNQIEDAKRHGENIFAFVQNRLAEVDGVFAKAKHFLEDEGKANKRCLKGWCINLRQCCRFNKMAKKLTSMISYQLKELETFGSVSCPAPLSGITSLGEIFNFDSFESRNSLMKEVMKALIDDNNVSKIGIWGMGGVGKTTLVKEINRRVIEAKEYGVVAMVTVSKTPSIQKIQGEIADMLGLTSLPTHSELARANSLWERIKLEKRVLVILDDVWKTIGLREIGIPFGNDHRGCKILITSRHKHVCDGMECQKIYTVEILSKEESWKLFSRIVGSIVDNVDINPIAREVATKCGGLPLAIVTMAGILRGQNRYGWSHIAKQLESSTLSRIPQMETNVLSSLELSFNYLEKDTKSLFLFCCLFPNDYKILVEDLVRYCKGLRFFGDTDDAIEAIRNRVHFIVSSITSSFLLIEEGEKYVKMPDVIRKFAIDRASSYNHEFMVDAGIGLEKWPHEDKFDFTCISLMTNYIRELPNGLEYLNLQALLLQENANLVVPSSFFEKMTNLKVLNLGQTYIKKLPKSLSSLTDLRMLDVSGSSLVDLSVIRRLSKLEILSLFGSKLVKKIPLSFSRLTNLRLLDLNNMDLELIPCGVLSSLQKLEELYINHFDKWESKGGSNANLVELEALSRLTGLHIFIPNNLDFLTKSLPFQKLSNSKSGSNANLVELEALSRLTSLHIFIPNSLAFLTKSLPFQKLSNFTLIIAYSPFAFEESQSKKYLSEVLYLRNMVISRINVSVINDNLKGLVKRTESLILEKIDNLESISDDLTEKGFDDLKYLKIESCYEIRYLVNTLERTTNSSFHNLEELCFDNCNLVEVCNGQPPTQSFYRLRVLKVILCQCLLNIAPSHLLQRFQNLRSLQMNECRSLVYIFDCEKIEIAKGETKLLSSLEYLDLKNLNKMTHIWKGDHRSISLHNLKRVKLCFCSKLIKLFSTTLLQSLSCLEELRINDCYELKEIFEKKEVEDVELDHTITSPCLGNLTIIDICGCYNLEILFTPSIAKLLVKLRRLLVLDCKRIQEIITNEKGEKEKPLESIVFPSLYHLQLSFLNSLTCFSSGPYTIEFPKLEFLEISGCRSMKTFGYGEQVTPKLKEVILDFTGRWNDNLNTTLEECFNEQGVAPLASAQEIGLKDGLLPSSEWDITTGVSSSIEPTTVSGANPISILFAELASLRAEVHASIANLRAEVMGDIDKLSRRFSPPPS